MPSFPGIGLVPAQGSAGKMTLLFKITDSDVRSAPIIAGEDNQRVLVNSTLLKCIQHLAHNGIGLHDKISVEIQPTFPFPLFIHRKRCVRRSKWHIEKKGSRFSGFPMNEFARAIPQGREHRLQLPTIQGWSLLACLVFDKELRRSELARNPDGAIILNEAVGRPIGNICAKELIEAHGCWPPGNGP